MVPSIDLDSVGGKLGFIGDYAGLSPYEKPRQFESLEANTLLLATQSDSKTLFEQLSNLSGTVQTSCRLSDTQFILAGNFTTINSTTYNHIAQFDTQTLQFSPLQQGLDGPVSSLLCINSSAVYVGGDFTAPMNTNASQYAGHVALWNNQQWTPLPWKGFNGPVYSIAKNSESIIFGGQFDSTGDGLYANQNTTRPFNLATSSTISSGNGAEFGNYTNPSSVICSQSPWLLQEGVPGYWQATFTSPIQPSVFRIKNANVNGDSTNRFNIIALGSNTYFNLSYIDPITKQTTTCSDQCFLSNDTSIEYQDFTVTSPMTAGGIRINIDTWYGSSGGLAGVNIFRSDVTLQPEITNSNSTINDSCYTESSEGTSIATTTGTWSQIFSYGTYQNFLVSTIPANELQTTNTSVVYKPYIASQGNYDVYLTTPGCVGTSTCNQRTQAELTVEMTPGNATKYYLNQDIVSDQQTLIYSGIVSSSTSTFQPSITMRVAPNATAPSSQSVSFIGSSVAFNRNTTGGVLSSVMVYYTSNNTWTPLAQQLPNNAVVRTLQSNDNMLYIGGLFALNSTYNNLVAYGLSSNTIQPLANSGLNGSVNTSLLIDSQLIVGGAFTGTSEPQQNADLQHVAIYNTDTNTWSGMDQGVNNNVDHLYTLDNNVIHLSGPFNSTGNTTLFNNAEWNLNDKRFETPSTFVLGPINSQLQINQDTRLLFGDIKTAQTYRANNIVALSSGQVSSSIIDPNAKVNAGVYWKGSSDTSLILAGSFNIGNTDYPLVINHQGGWHGLLQGIQGEITVLSVVQNILWIGGQFSGTVDTISMTSLAAYDLQKQAFLPTNGLFGANQQPGLVRVITPSGDGKSIYVAGSFAFAGLLDCSSLCKLSTDTRQWNRLSQNLSGTVNDVLINDNSVLIAIGDLNVGQTKANLASLDITSSSASWTAAPVDNQMSSPTSIVHENDQTYIISGASQNNASPYLSAWNGQNFTSISSNLGSASSIRQLLWAPISSSSDASIARYPADSDTMLLAVGHLEIPEFGSSSAAFFDGTQWHPYLLTASVNGSSGTIGRVFTAEPCCTSVSNHRHFLSVPAVILISIAISLGILFVLIGCAFVVLFFKRRHTAVAAYDQDPMKEWKPKHRPSSLLAMLNAANLNGGEAGPSGYT
ncbi:Polarized growth protein rax2 [Choanephora cucurbitarum]|uniref:Polarized growth protein rax2 n=1 Tax=Choanephora cucurbitarum TaxID=101091 RepID=A0A1C7N826_9FUNG|nr:Polarized growth protein rax2 [Choanephora cucurbitarum]